MKGNFDPYAIEEPTPEEYAADHERDVEACLSIFVKECQEFVCKFREDFNAYLDAFCDKYGFEKQVALYLLLLMPKVDQLEKDAKED